MRLEEIFMSLNVFSKHYCSYHNVGLKRKIREPFLRLKWAYQRITRGYTDFDCLELDWFYGKMISETLQHFASSIHGWPASGEKYPTCEDWQEALRAAAKDFDFIKTYDFEGNKVSAYFYERFQKKEPTDEKLWNKYRKEDDEVRNAAVNRAFDFLKTNWFDLWD
jgi:hypothetical protein